MYLNSFAGLEMSKQALSAFRLGIQTAGHNTANVKTEGYSRQRVELSTTTPYTSPGLSSPAIPGQLGTGVKADEIVRIRDEFLDFQYRSEMTGLGYWEKINKMYENVQLYLSEPAGDGVRAAFDDFFATVQELQKQPEDLSIRRSVVESARSIGDMIDGIVKGYDNYSSMINQEVKSAVDEVNDILYDIAALNKEIYAVQAMEQNPNDLLDKRDLLLDKLSGMLDIEISEPFESGDITGEFFLTLNGMTLVQGSKVRELVAHAFYWEDDVYYDVQVTDNEFDIVENPDVALALATGPEGVHQLNVNRLANGESWGVGGADPYCLTEVTTSQDFENGVVISNADGEAGKTLAFNVALGSDKVNFFVKWMEGPENPPGSGTFDPDYWQVVYSGAASGTIELEIDPATGENADLTVDMLKDIMNKAFDSDSDPATPPVPALTVESNGKFFTINKDAGADPNAKVAVEDLSGLLGIMTRNVPLIVMGENQMMRVRPLTTTEALELTTSFSIQVGTQGTLVPSKIFNNTGSGLPAGDILGKGTVGDDYTFRVGAGDYQIDINVSWDDAAGKWRIKSDTGVSGQSAGGNGNLSVDDIASFLREALPSSGTDNTFTVNTGSDAVPTRFSIASDNKYLISISDVKGNLAEQMGIVNPNPVITIDVTSKDSLETIRNKINEKYQEEYGLTSPEDWVHASLVQDADQSWYLTIESNVPGEEGRITLMGDDNGSMQTLRRLGLVTMEQISSTGAGGTGQPIYREVTAYSSVAEDAYFTFNGVSYLSSDNKIYEARRVPAGLNRNDYSASKLETISEGLYLELKSVGHTAINVKHHVKDGSIKALEEIRDNLIPRLKADLDEVAWSLVNSFNAYQYSGYGIAGNGNTTGVEFFNELNFKSGAASLVDVFDMLANDVSLIGAAMGETNEEGKAVNGKSAESGSGANAARMAALQSGKLLENGTASLGEYYETYLAQIGSKAGSANLMYKAQLGLTEQIDEQRQAVMGVNIDEEMLDILMFNHAFNAMSRYATTIDEMLDKIINSFGTVGR